MKPVKILIQGGYGAFHEMAARHYFGDVPIEILPRNTFRELIRSLKKHQADYGIMAIENSLAGSILPNYALLRDSPMFIVGEIYLRIKQNLWPCREKGRRTCWRYIRIPWPFCNARIFSTVTRTSG